MRCQNCNNDLKTDARFCTKCGMPISKKIDIQDKPLIEENINSTLIKKNEEKNSTEKKSFVWQEKFTYIVIVLAIVLAAGLGFVVKANKLSKLYNKEDVINEFEKGYMDLNQELANASDGDINDKEFFSGNEKVQNDEYEQIQYEENVNNMGENDEVGIHTYELIVDDVTWTEAYTNCLRMGGHLVRINSDDEYNAILQQIQNEYKSNIKFWIGGYRDNNEEYRWAYNNDFDGRGEIFLGDIVLNYDPMYTERWLEGEPSFYDDATGTEENRMNMFYMEELDKWVWNDVPDNILEVASFYAGTIGYICEYE